MDIIDLKSQLENEDNAKKESRVACSARGDKAKR